MECKPELFMWEAMRREIALAAGLLTECKCGHCGSTYETIVAANSDDPVAKILTPSTVPLSDLPALILRLREISHECDDPWLLTHLASICEESLARHEPLTLSPA